MSDHTRLDGRTMLEIAYRAGRSLRTVERAYRQERDVNEYSRAAIASAAREIGAPPPPPTHKREASR